MHNGSDKESSVIFDDTTCGCGQPGRYVHGTSDDPVYACNKYARCMTYEQLDQRLKDTLQALYEMYEVAEALALYRDGTTQQIDAYKKLQRFDKNTLVWKR